MSRDFPRIATLVAFALLVWLAPVAGHAQDQGTAGHNWFRVSWQPGVLPSTIEGQVYNASPFRAIDVRLQIEGLDSENHRLAERVVWAGDDIAPGATTSYFAETIPGAVDYRITVASFELVSERGAVAADESVPAR